jgi:hypothetical protein
MSFASEIRDRTSRPGAYVPQDFDVDQDLAGQYLSRLARTGWLERVGKGIYVRGDVQEKEVVKAVLRKLGEPRFIPARSAAMEELGLPVTNSDPAAITTGKDVRRYTKGIPGWVLVRRHPDRQNLTVDANLILEAIRYSRRWPTRQRKQIEKALVAYVSEQRASAFVPALPHERPSHGEMLVELAERAGWGSAEILKLNEAIEYGRELRRRSWLR